MKIKIGLALASILLIASCATPKMAELQNSEPLEAVKEIENFKNRLIDSGADVLAKDSFEKGNEDLTDAKKALKSKESREEIMSELAQAKAHYIETQKSADSRSEIPESIMDARKSAIEAGLFSSQSLKIKLGNVDDSLISSTDEFSESLSADKLAAFQAQYLKLEVEAVQNTQLGEFRRIIKDAKSKDATELAPKTLKNAESDLKIAENLINQSPRDPSQYRDYVDKANKSAKLLDDVMNKLVGTDKGSSESTALKLVLQERELGNLSGKVVNLEGTLASKNTKMGMMSKDIENQKTQILNSQNQIRFQNAMNQVRKSFSEDEATVYQQGEQLIVRLKKINFKSGSATIPTGSMPLLSKISTIITDLNPKEVVIEGHTDATGDQDNNLMLSKKRANAVKTYFSTLDVKYQLDARGFGEANPIANNQTAQGRTLNRRVDIVVKANQ